MARVPEAEIERLKAEVSLVSLVKARGVELRKAGADLVGRCPFHDDHSGVAPVFRTGLLEFLPF